MVHASTRVLSSVGGAAMAAAIGHRASAAAAGEPFCFCVAADPHCNDAPAKGMEDLGTGADRLLRVLDRIGALRRPIVRTSSSSRATCT